MPHTYAQNAIHVVFSTKDRAKLIPKDFQPRLWSYAAGICRQGKIFVHAFGGMDDHIHLLIQIPPSLALAKAVNAVKSNSSRWANEEGFPFAWQQGRVAKPSTKLGPSFKIFRVPQPFEHCAKGAGFDFQFDPSPHPRTATIFRAILVPKATKQNRTERLPPRLRFAQHRSVRSSGPIWSLRLAER
jgi:REP element-mobilizing transposase RayT